MLRAAQDVWASSPGLRVGTVSNYDPGSHSVKVMLQPENILTGWIPLRVLATGNGFGVYCAPNLGDTVEVLFQEDSLEAPSAGLRFHDDAMVPPIVGAGEILIRHQSGSLLKFQANGDVELATARDLRATVGGSLTAQVAGNATFAVTGSVTSSAAAWNHTGAMNLLGNLAVTGNIGATGNIVDLSGSNSKTMANMRTVYNTHTHPETGTGGGTTNPPNQPI